MLKEPPVKDVGSIHQTVRFLALEEEIARRIARETARLGYSVTTGNTIEDIVNEPDDEEHEGNAYVVVTSSRRRDRVHATVSILARSAAAPIILVSGSLAEGDRLQALRMGATAILENTLSAREIALRISSLITVLERPKQRVSRRGSFSLGEDVLEIDEAAHKVYLNRDFLRLTETEWRILHRLAARAEAIVSRDTLVHECMGYSEEDAYVRSLDAHIKNLRRKLGRPDWIETIRGYGYQFVGTVQTPLD